MNNVNKHVLTPTEQRVFREDFNEVRECLIILRKACTKATESHLINQVLSIGNGLLQEVGGKPLEHGETITRKPSAPAMTVTEARKIKTQYDSAVKELSKANKAHEVNVNLLEEKTGAHEEARTKVSAGELFEAQEAHAETESKVNDAQENVDNLQEKFDLAQVVLKK